MTFIQFSVPRADDFSIDGVGVTFREEPNGKRTLKGGGGYGFSNNSGFYSRTNGSSFSPVIEIKNIDGQTVHTINSPYQKLPKSSSGQQWSFSISENKPYDFLRYNSLKVSVKFVSSAGSRKPIYPDGTPCNKNCSHLGGDFNRLLSSNVASSSLVSLVNVQEETRLADIERARVESVEESRLLELLNQDYGELSKPLNVNSGIAGIAGFAIIGLLLYSKGGLK
tara:strand:+ start:564 stop:1235 length:672 start_codon:yes stop_codon:yes gene_type:complete